LHHARNLRRLLKNDGVIKQLETDYTQAELSPANRAMLDYSAKLTRTPWEMNVEDVEGLKRVGFTDRAILDIAQIVAYYAYVNRIADGLGVSMEDYWNESRDEH
jgi:uncharacterized peroxidase-related enzyme